MHHDVSPFMKAYVKNYISIYDSCLSSLADTECAPCRTECLEHSDESFPLVLDLISNSPPCSCSFPSHRQVPVTKRFPISFRHRKLFYKVRWKGYPPSEDTWQPTNDLANAPDLIAKFHADYPWKPRPGSLAPNA